MFKQIIEFIELIIGKNDAEILAEASLKEDLGMNSYETSQLFGMLEDEFDIAIPAKKIRELKTIQNIMDYLNENVEA